MRYSRYGMSPENEEFEFTLWSPTSRGVIAIWRDGRLMHGGRYETPLHEAAPTAADWQTFWEAVDLLRVWEWEPSFARDQAADGWGWSLRIRRGARRAECTGYRAKPVGFDTLRELVRRLTGAGLAEDVGGLLADAARAGQAFDAQADAVEPLLDLLSVAANGFDEERAIRALGRLGWPALPAMPALLAALRGSPVAPHALLAVARSVQSADPAAVAPLLDEALPVLTRAAWDTQFGVGVLLEALARMAPDRLPAFLRHPNPQVVRATALAYVTVGLPLPADAFSALMETLRECNAAASGTGPVVEALRLLFPGAGEDAAAALLAPQLQSADLRARQCAAEGMAAAGAHAGAAVEAILPSLRHADSATRRWAIEALALFRAHAAAAAPALLASLASEPEPDTRLAAVNTLRDFLSNWAFRRTSPPLEPLVAEALATALAGDTSRDVRHAAAETVLRMGPAAAGEAPALLAAFSTTGLDARTRVEIARVLRAIAPETTARTIGGLEAILMDSDDDSTRLAAADLLDQFE